jgi:hypothetical protein
MATRRNVDMIQGEDNSAALSDAQGDQRSGDGTSGDSPPDSGGG